MSITDQLAEFARADCTAPDVLHMMRLSIFDWAVCGIAGRCEPVSRMVRDMVTAEAGTAEATLFGGGRAPARSAALVNGVTSHALDYDDTHFAHIGHPSVAVVSAGLAVAEKTGASGDALVQAAFTGVEASTRIGVWLGREHYQTGFHQTGTAGCFGAAIAAARLLGCDHAAMTHAIGLASTRAAGLKSQFGTMGKPYNAGAAAAMGVEVALLAQAGFVSNPEALDSAQGFGPTHAGVADNTAFEGLGSDWMFEQISHKFHACCHGTHAMIEALLGVDVTPSDVTSLEVRTHPSWLKVCNQPSPVTGLEAKFSYRFIAALVLSGHDTASLETFSDALTQDAALNALRDKVTVTGDAQISESSTRVVIKVAGHRVEAAADISEPMDIALRQTKLISKARALIGPNADALIEAVLDGDMLDIDRLATLLGQGE